MHCMQNPGKLPMKSSLYKHTNIEFYKKNNNSPGHMLIHCMKNVGKLLVFPYNINITARTKIAFFNFCVIFLCPNPR